MNFQLNSKKEKTVLLICAIIISSFIYLMPNIDGFFRNKVDVNTVKNNNNSSTTTTTTTTTESDEETVVENTEETEFKTKYSCDIKVDNSVSNSSETAIFSFDDDNNLQVIDSSKTVVYVKVEDYNSQKSILEKATKVIGIIQENTFDDNNKTIKIASFTEISKLTDKTVVTYPTKLLEFENYLTNNKYTCTKE